MTAVTINLSQLRKAGKLAEQHQKVEYLAGRLNPHCLDITITVGANSSFELPQRVVLAMLKTAQGELAAMLNEIQLHNEEAS